jgi:hypothetical protein
MSAGNPNRRFHIIRRGLFLLLIGVPMAAITPILMDELSLTRSTANDLAAEIAERWESEENTQGKSSDDRANSE